MKYQIQILRSAQKQLAKISEADRSKVINAVSALADDPRPHGAIRLTNRAGWRIRIGDYRVIYEIRDRELLVLVVAFGHRREIYR